MLFGPLLPLLLLAIPVGVAAIVLIAGAVTLLRRPPPLPRAVLVDRAKPAR